MFTDQRDQFMNKDSPPSTADIRWIADKKTLGL